MNNRLLRTSQQHEKQLEARVVRDLLLAAGWPKEAFDYPRFVRRCSERQCVAYKSGLGEMARLFGLRQAERIFDCPSSTVLFFRDKLSRVDDKDVFEIPKDLVEQTREAVRVEQTRPPPPDPSVGLLRMEEQLQRFIAQQQEQREREMKELKETQRQQQEQHAHEMKELKETQRQQQEQHEREMRQLREALEGFAAREKPQDLRVEVPQARKKVKSAATE